MAIVKDFYGKERIPSASAKPAAPKYTPPTSGWTSSDQRAEQQAIRNLQKAPASAPVYTAQSAQSYAPSASGWTSNDQRAEQLAIRQMADTFETQQKEAADAFRQRLNSENAYWMNPADEQRAEQSVLQSAMRENEGRTVSAWELLERMQARTEDYKHYDHSFYSMLQEVDTPSGDSDADYFETAEMLQGQIAELQQMQQQVKSGERNFGNKKRNQQFLEFVDEKIAGVETQLRRDLLNYAEESRITKYAQSQLSHLAYELSYAQLGELNTVIKAKGVRRVTQEYCWEQTMRKLLSNRETAEQVVVDENYSVIAPHICGGASVAEQADIAISGYYYENRQYWLDIA